MPLFRPTEPWLEAVNRNLLPLLERFGIRRQGRFALQNIIVPVVNVETLEEVLSTAQLTATVSAVLTNIGDQALITVPAGETWQLEQLSGFTAQVNSQLSNRLGLVVGGNFYGLGVWSQQHDILRNTERAEGVTFAIPVFLAAGDSVAIRRVQNSGVAATSRILLHYRSI